MEFCFPPSSSWYSSHVLSVAPNGDVAYASKGGLVVLQTFLDQEDQNGDPPKAVEENEDSKKRLTFCKPQATIVPTAFFDRAKISQKVTAVSWTSDGNHVAVASDGGFVKLFAYTPESLTPVKSHSMHKDFSTDKRKISAICCSKVGCDLVTTGDDGGNLVIWDTKVNKTRSFSFSKQTIFVLAAHPYNDDIVAYGCRLGLLYIVNISSQNSRILHKIRAHDEDVQGLSWSPSPTRDVLPGPSPQETPLEESLLAVSSRDKTISVWSSLTGRQVAKLKLPFSRTSGSASDKGGQASWISVYWMQRESILSSGPNGELYLWNLDAIDKISNQGIYQADGRPVGELNLVHREHFKHIYGLGASRDGVIFTCGHDRTLNAFDKQSWSFAFQLPMFASGIFCMASNVLDPTLLAIGAGDGQVRIWKSASSKGMFEVNCIYQRLNGAKVTAIAWHPLKESLLAIGTDEGRVGVLDALSTRQSINFYDFKHRGQVYNLAWGPPVPEKDAESEIPQYHLYSLADGFIFMHPQRTSGSEKSTNVEDVINLANGFTRKPPSRSDIAFKLDSNSLEGHVAIGSEDGSVEIYRLPGWKITVTLKSFHKLIQSLAWHPTFVGKSLDRSNRENWLAVASNENDIHLWDVDLNKVNQVEDDHEVRSKPDVVLSGHLTRVISLSWSPHEEGKLLSVSYDQTGQVWDAFKKEPALSNFAGHQNRLLCGIWSPTDKDVVITAGDDCTVFGWRVSQQDSKLPTKKTKKAPTTEERAIVDDSVSNLIKTTSNLSLMSQNSNEDNNSVAAAATSRTAFSKKKRLVKKVYFPLASSSEATHKDNVAQDCQDILQVDSKVDITKKPHLGFFSDNPEDCVKLLTMERAMVNDNQGGLDLVNAPYLTQWSGDGAGVADLVKSAMEAGRLNDWLVSLAAGTSHNLWREACESYAVQLSKSDDAVKSASYYLMIHKVVDAIEVLRSNNFYQAAISIAKSRLPPDSPIIVDIYKSWALSAYHDGMLDLAAKAWLAAGEYHQAASCLSKRSDGASLKMAADLMTKAGENEKARVLAFQAMEAFKTANDKAGLKALESETTFEDLKKAITALQDDCDTTLQNGESTTA